MKILLCNSPVFESSTKISFKSLPPLGLGYIATELEKLQYNVKLIDSYNSELSLADSIEQIKKFDPDVLIINIFSINKELVFKIIKSLKLETKIIIGGGVKGIDFSESLILHRISLIQGDGEKIIPSLLKNSKDYKIQYFVVDNDSEFYLSNLSDVELNHSFFVNDPQINKFDKVESYLLYSRGCVHSCTFCGSSQKMTKSNRRTRNARSIIAELESLSNKVQHIRFLDDLLIDDSNDIEVITTALNKFSFTWSGMISILSVKKALNVELKKLATSGCEELYIGIESGSVETLKRFNKYSNISDITFNLKRLLEIGINIKVFLILGAYKETEYDLKQTLNFAESLANLHYKGRVRFSPFMYKAYEGTELYLTIIKEMIVSPEKAKLNEGIEKDSSNRMQFNVTNGNYSNCSIEVINQYIDKIIGLNYI
jgi:anaerobic magnesium-protoporphyrin IX monomethyl ester cyclase